MGKPSLKNTLVICAAFISLNASAAFYSGNDLLERLRDYQKSQSNNITTAAAGFGFVIGVTDSLNNLYDSRTDIKFCVPKHVTAGQLVDVVLLYLEANPKFRHLTAFSIVAAAYAEAFPCSE